jgi:NAD(P)-dependent dehydrogenase (short-subunit alcohol dehydrogenase family)
LTNRGFEVIATARRLESLRDLDVPERLALDVDDATSVAAAVANAGVVDVLINNAGVGILGPIERVPLSEAKRGFETNFFGAVRMIQSVLPQMRERPSGTIVNVSSVGGRTGGPLNGFYCGSKFALEGMSEALKFEVGHFGVRVVVIEPGLFATQFFENERYFGVDTEPYDELRRQWDATTSPNSLRDAASPEIVGAAIGDIIENNDPTVFRVAVGADAQMVLGVRSSMDDLSFERTMRDALGFRW